MSNALQNGAPSPEASGPAVPLPAAIQPSWDLVAARIEASFSIHAIRDAAYDYYRTSGVRVSDIADSVLLDRLAQATEKAAASIEADLDTLPHAARKPLLTRLLLSFIEDPRHMLARLDPAEAQLLERIELLAAGILIERFGKEIDLSDPLLTEAGCRRIQRNLQNGSIPALQHIAGLSQFKDLETPTVLGALVGRFMKVHHESGERQALQLLEHYPYDRMLPSLMFAQQIRDVVSTYLLRELCSSRERDANAPKVLAKKWAADAFSNLPSVVQQVTQRLIAAGCSLNTNVVTEIVDSIDPHPLSASIIDSAKPMIQPYLLSRIRAGSVEQNRSYAGKIRTVAFEVIGPNAFLSETFDDAARRGFNLLLEQKAPIDQLLGQFSHFPPVHREPVIGDHATRAEIIGHVLDRMKEFQASFLEERPRLDRTSQLQKLDYMEANLGAAVTEFGVPHSELEAFREFARENGPGRLYGGLQWWRYMWLRDLDPDAMGHHVEEHQTLFYANKALHRLMNSFGEGFSAKDIRNAKAAVDAIQYADAVPSDLALQGKQLLIAALLSQEKNRAELLAGAIDWNMTYLAPDSEDVQLCFAVAAKMMEQSSGSMAARPFARLAAGIARANPGGDYDIPLSANRIAALSELARDYREVSSSPAIVIAVNRAPLKRAAEWIEAKIALQSPLDDGQE